MATTSKLSFRARNLDANKPMVVFFADELPDLSECAPINRAVAQMPTGMEKEEENEKHLQDAIVAQQASTSGIAMENHVIPTPKVLPVDENIYDSIYPKQPPLSKDFIRVQAWLSLDQEEPEYDMDSDDEAWLKDRPQIAARDLEKIFETLESRSSDSQICLPDTARSVLTAFDESVVDDVYDYWLNKRKEVTTSRGLIGCGGLIPRIRVEPRKDGSVNPYVAFRKRAEKMQTRKNRKNDEDSYEKVLKIGHDLRRTVTLVDLVKKREKMKLVLLEEEMDILRIQMELGDFDSSLYNQVVQSLKVVESPSNGPFKEENGVPKRKPKKKKPRTIVPADREIPNKAWLEKNADLWNMPPSMSGVFASPVLEVKKTAATQSDELIDGPYTFKRRRNCQYRAARVPCRDPPAESELPDLVPPERHFYRTSLPVGGVDGGMRNIGFARKRIGRGGRVIFDRLIDTTRVPKNGTRILDPFEQDMLLDNRVSFSARIAPVPSDDEPPPSFTSRPSTIRQWGGSDSDCERESEWLASAVSPSPLDDDRPPPPTFSDPTSDFSSAPPSKRQFADDVNASPADRTASPPRALPSFGVSNTSTTTTSSTTMNGGSGNGYVGRVGHPVQYSNTTNNDSQPAVSNPSSQASSCHLHAAESSPMEVVVSSEVLQMGSAGRSSDDSWMVHDNSRSPSESNSSADWAPPTSQSFPSAHGGRGVPTAYTLLSSEEETAARTGDHPKKQAKPGNTTTMHHNIKSLVGTTVVDGLISSRALLAPAPSVG